MVGEGRLLITAIKTSHGFSLLHSNAKPLYTFSTPNQKQLRRPPVQDISLISKRFLHNEYGSSFSRSKWSLASGLFAAAVGTIIGLGSKLFVDHKSTDSSWKGFFHAACATKSGCECKEEEKCVERKCEDSPCLRSMECEEELIRKANADLEYALKETKAKVVEYTEYAIEAYCAAIKIMQQYMNNAYCLLDVSDNLEPQKYEEAWCCIYNIALERCAAVKDALQKGMCAWELLCCFREIIEEGKNCKYTSCNPLLPLAEETFDCAEQKLLELKKRMDDVSSQHKMVEQFQEVIAEFRKELRVEVDDIVKNDTVCNIQYTEQETALMIIQAYKKVLRVQKEAAQAMVCIGNVPEPHDETEC